MRLPLTTIGRGAYSGRTVAGRIACTEDQTWRDLWNEHMANEPSSRPAVDFSSEAVLAVFAGQRPSSGWTVEITSAETPEPSSPAAVRGTLTVRYVIRAPLGPAQDVLTHPFHIVRVPRKSWDRAVFESSG